MEKIVKSAKELYVSSSALSAEAKALESEIEKNLKELFG